MRLHVGERRQSWGRLASSTLAPIASVALATFSCNSKPSVTAEKAPQAATLSSGEGPESTPAPALMQAPAPTATLAALAPESAHASAPAPTFADWLRARLPPGGTVVTGEDGKVAVVHTAVAGDTARSIARAYLDLTDVYFADDLAKAIAAQHASLKAGTSVAIPHLLSEPYKSPEDDRLRWPPERALKGVYISGLFAGAYWPATLQKLGERKLNAVVLDGKGYGGPITYPSHVKLALETGAAKNPPIPDMSRAIRFAHARGVHVIVRIACFHDPWTAKNAPRLSLMSDTGKPFQMGWLDPANAEAQDYVVDLAREAVDLGADEIQLDYVRFPVQSRGISHAVLPLPDGHRSQAMKAFVQRVHEVTEAHHVPLSLDVFGVTATDGTKDIEALGQNLGVIGAEADAVSPMLYPSHYGKGYLGFAEPGNHPEIIGIGTRGALERLKAANVATIVRPWLQAMAFKSSAFGPQYVASEIKSAESSGAVGWLMWDPQNTYWAVWEAIPPVKD